MMITERTLRQWRKDALKDIKITHSTGIKGETLNIEVLHRLELDNRVLRLTQELLDQHLLRKE